MKSLTTYCIVLLALMLVVPTALMAQAGRIQGRILDQGGNPVPFANVLIQGTSMGAASNANGEYSMNNVPPNRYTLTASAVGFRARTADVDVTAGQTVTQDFTLGEDVLGMKEVVVTGTITPRQKLESSVAISTMGLQQVQAANPRSTTEMLRYVPGFTRVESSGGEVNQNISMRGILGVEYVMFMEDGMPVFPTMHTFFMNADNLVRPDENISSVEIIRGGNSALYGSNTPGAIINFINKTGGAQLGGSLRATAGTGNLARYDFDFNGPLAEQWRFNLGGFYRYDRGVRDPGFPGTRGGQLKANLTRLLDSGYIRVSTKIIDDQNQFILDLPFQDPTDPQYVAGFSDFGSMNTNEGNHIRVPIPTGELELPLDNGIATQASWLTGDVAFNFPDRWSIQNTAQIMQNAQQWNAIVPFDAMQDSAFFGSDFAKGLKIPAGARWQFFYTNHFDPTGKRIPLAPNSLIAPGGEWHVEKPISAFQDQFQVKKSVGPHNFSLGAYFAQYMQTNRWYFTDITTDVADNPRFLDLVYYTATDTVQATKNGFRNYLSNYVNGEGQTSIFSGVVSANLQLMDQLRLDLGGRWESDNFVQNAENTSNRDLDKDTATRYDVETWGNGSFRHFNQTLNDWAASAGLNYTVTDQWAVYAQGSRAYKMPALDEYLNASSEAQVALFESRQVYFVEGGVKYASPTIGFTVDGFWGLLKNIVGQGAVLDTATGRTTWITTTSPENRSYGAEVEASVIPVPGLTLLGNGTWLKAELGSGAGADIGSWINGVPKFIGNLSVQYLASGITFLGDWHYVGARFSDFASGSQLPAYNYFNFGASYKIPANGVTLEANLLNAFQSRGLEEGNPRLTLLGGRTSNIFLARPLLPRRLTIGARYQF